MTTQPLTLAPEVVPRDGNAAILFAASAAAAQAAYAANMATTRNAVSAWLNSRPVNDDEMREWMNDFDRIQGNAARQHEMLTRSWANMSLRSFGATAQPLPWVDPEPSLIEPLRRWVDGPIPDIAPELAADALAILDRVDAGTASVADLAKADRIPSLHSPVLDVRTRLSVGEGLFTAHRGASGHIARIVDASLRSTENATIRSIRWPTFKDGTAMMAIRVPQAGACGWCRVVSTRLYSLASLRRGAMWHTACRCAMRMATEAEAKAYNDAFKRSEGNYYEAAAAVGNWTGPTRGVNYNDVVAQRATTTSTPDAQGVG